MKDNPVAKNAHKFNKAQVHKDRKKAVKKGDRKHKGQRYEDSGDIEERSTLDAISSVLKRNKDRGKYQAALKAVKSGKYKLPKAAQVFDVSPKVLQDLVSEERNYKKEYENYHSNPEQKKRRAARNGARRMLKDRKNIKGMDVHHKDNDPMNNDKSNLSIVTQKYNRTEPRLRKESVREAMDYNKFDKQYTELEKKQDAANAALKKAKGTERGAMGLTPDSVKNSPKYKKAKADYERATNEIKKFLKGVPKDYLSKRAKARRMKRFNTNESLEEKQLHINLDDRSSPRQDKVVDVLKKHEKSGDIKHAGSTDKGELFDIKNAGAVTAINRELKKLGGGYQLGEGNMKENGKGLWANIRAKQKRGEAPAKPGDKDYPKTLDIESVKEDISEAKYEIKNGKVHISKAEFRKVHGDFKNTTRGKERMMASGKGGAATSYPVVFTEETISEMAMPRNEFEKLKKGDKLKFTFDSSMKKGHEVSLVVTGKSRSAKYDVEKVNMKDANDSRNRTKFTLYSRSGKDATLAWGDAATVMQKYVKESVNEGKAPLFNFGVYDKDGNLKGASSSEKDAKSHAFRIKGKMVKFPKPMKQTDIDKKMAMGEGTSAQSRLDRGAAKHGLGKPNKAADDYTAKLMKKYGAKDMADLKKKMGIKESLGENFRTLATKGMGAEKKTDIRVGHGVDYYDKEAGNKHTGKVVKMGPKSYDVKDEKTGKVHTFDYFDPAKARKMMKESSIHELTQRELDMIAQRKAGRTKSGKVKKPEADMNIAVSKKGADDHIVMQLRKAQDVNGNMDIKVSPTGKTARLPKGMIDKLLKTYDRLSKPDEKRKFRILVTKELRKKAK